jgi:chemosensory pili system protein ChpA (sensor histidine kinase/response regulator)
LIHRRYQRTIAKAVTTVLLIDDSKFLRRANEAGLVRAGYSILSAADGEEGLRLACDTIPDVIILDMMLPKLGGPELLHLLKHDARTAHIPVIVLSGLAQKNEGKLKKAGAAAYLEKSKLDVENSSSLLSEAIKGVLSNSP